MKTPAVLATFGVMADAHGGLTFPPPRNNYHNIDPTNLTRQPGSEYHPGGPCAGDECLWFNEGCFIGCQSCLNEMPLGKNYYGKPNCEKPMEPTLPEKFRTWNIGNVSPMGDYAKYHPWRAPGHAPVEDPCGMAGGYKTAQGGGGQTPDGAQQFDRGSKLPKLGVKTEWLAGDAVEVGWMLGANHGGGYVYSLCPASEPLSEACFQSNMLPFVGTDHIIRYMDSHSQLIIPATDVSEGTYPEGSTWRRNPIPACNCDAGDDCGVNNSTERQSYADEGPPVPYGFPCPTGTQFPVPFDYGYGQHIWNNEASGPGRGMWAIVDRVRVPQVTGDFVLRWRWDTEMNPQIWTHCADVTIVSGEAAVV